MIKYLKDVQVQSAILWAMAILGVSLLSGSSAATMFVISLAGGHVVLLAGNAKRRKAC